MQKYEVKGIILWFYFYRYFKSSQFRVWPWQHEPDLVRVWEA